MLMDAPSGVPWPGEPAESGLACGDHVAVFYRGAAERDELVQAFFEPAIAAGEFCACLADEEAAAALRRLFGRRVAIIEPQDVPEMDLGDFDPYAMARFWQETAARVTGDGRAARLAGVMTWLLGDPKRTEHLARFEAAVGPLVAPYPVTGWCLYDLERFDAGILLDAARTHSKLFIDGTYIENPHHLHPDFQFDPPGPSETALRNNMASLHGIVILGRLMMTAATSEEISRLCLGAATSLLSDCGIVALAQAEHGERLEEPRFSVSGLSDGERLTPSMSRALAGLAGYLGDRTLQEDSLRLLGYPWSCAIPLRFSGRNLGWLLAACPKPPEGEREVRSLLHALAGQAAAALATHRAASANEARARELRTLSDQLQQAVRDRDRLLEVHGRLTDAGVFGRGATGIADVLCNVLEAPVVIEDAGGLPLATAPAPEDFRAGDPRIGPMRARMRTEGTFIQSERVAAQPVTAGGRLLASIWTTAAALGDESGHIALERGAIALKLELEHERAVAQVELRARGGITDDLVAGVTTPEVEASIDRRARLLGVDISSVRVAAIRPAQAARDMEGLARRLPYPLVSARHDHVIAVIDAEEGSAAVHHAAQEAAGGQACAVGIGSRCETPAEASRSYERALQALEIAQTRQGVVCHEDLGLLGVLVAAGDRQALDDYLQRWLDALISHEREHGGQLLETLTSYLETGGSLAGAAERLHVHVNTVKYRLKRIEQITGVDLSDQDVRFQLRVAVTAGRALGVVEAPAVSERA